ncbi:aryl-alcohol dehydrogenase-like predicted oxidoreductase [Kribbella aluminosa]|uniref:Aryl-alcohol dehydrogenase-like predicted oxidoreductase n=1 Tax=Kribbella aluminosa TaxID=416017 RepID=A0ABS4UYY1_9ACTN|nr:aldo/keto reductase [Kribbella aluminosa]MBP2356798.1 aryl-alcohol dehydrogenase-like predicted oxidoreductase [Kribbella aluminosa]
MTSQRPGGTVKLGQHEIARIGYGAMQLEHLDTAAASAVLRRAVELGINHLDTASFYGHTTVNAHIRAALHPYPGDLVIVSKVGARRVDAPVPLTLAQRPEDLREQVHLDLTSLGLEQVPVVNLRRADQGPGLIAEGDQVVPLDDQLAELIALRNEGLIGAIGLSNVSTEQLTQALPAGIVCVQNVYNLLDRSSEDQLALCAAHDIAWIPYFPLGSAFAGTPPFEHLPVPTEHPVVRRRADRLATTPAAVCLAWILAHDNHTALIPGTRSVSHLEDNVRTADVHLDADALAELDNLS